MERKNIGIGLFYLILVVTVCYGLFELLSKINTYVALITAFLCLFILTEWLPKIRKGQM